MRTETRPSRCPIKNILKKILKFYRKTPAPESIFKEIADLKLLYGDCFVMYFDLGM